MGRKDEWLAAALKAGAEEDAARDDCPSPERIWSAVRLDLPLAERLQVIDHVVECAGCADEWRMFADRERQQTAQGGTAHAWTWILRPVVWVPVTAALVIGGDRDRDHAYARLSIAGRSDRA